MQQLQQQSQVAYQQQMMQQQYAPPPQQQHAPPPPLRAAQPEYNAEADPKLIRMLNETRKTQDELLDTAQDMLERVDDVYERLTGHKRGRRSRSRATEDAISPIEMLQSLQQLVDEHGAMEQESLAKDDEVASLRHQLAEARERQAILIEEKHQFLMQQNQVLLNKQADQQALVELQITKETNSREIGDVEAKLSAALASSEGMASVDREISRMRDDQADAVNAITAQLALKDAQLAERRSELAEVTSPHPTQPTHRRQFCPIDVAADRARLLCGR